MESFVIYMCFNYFISGFLSLHGDFFGVDYSQNAGAGTGLAMIANIKTLDGAGTVDGNFLDQRVVVRNGIGFRFGFILHALLIEEIPEMSSFR